MSLRVRTVVLCAIPLASLLVIPAVAGAAQKSVSLGPPKAAQKAIQRTGSDVNDFFPHRVRIHVGDTVRFVPANFHTVDLPGSRRRKLPLITPTGQPVAGSLDAAGAPFWFNGLPLVGFNPTLLKSGFGKTRSYTGAKSVLSGLPLANKPKPMIVKFTKTGTFRYFCDIHFGMTGIVRVVSKSRAVPSAGADRARVRAQLASTLKTAKALPKRVTPPPNTVDVGLSGKGNVSFFGFVPQALTVPHGTTVTFAMRARTEVHTATTGPGNPLTQPNSYLGQIANSLVKPVFDPRAVYPSDPPPALAALTPTFHGNGFWSSGALDLDPATPTVGTGNRVLFAGPGTYQVYCMIHPFMHATVTVT